MIKTDFIALVRSELHEAVAKLWTDADIIKFADAELRVLPKKSVYLEEIWEGNTVVNRDDYPLPSGTRHIEKLEFNESTSGQPCWIEDIDYDVYGNVLYLSYLPAKDKPFRLRLKKSFTPISSLGNSGILDVPDSVLDVVVKGTVLRCLSQMMVYFLDASNWDAIAKPDGISAGQVQNWIKDYKREYQELLALCRTVPKPKFINLLG